MAFFKRFNFFKKRRNRTLKETYKDMEGRFVPSSLPEDVLLWMNSYYKDKQIGKGAFGVVYQGKFKKRSKETLVAIKVIYRNKLSENARKKHLPRELRNMNKLQHKNISNLLDVLHSDKNAYLIMDLAPNGTIKDFLNRNGPIKESLVRDWFYQIVESLQYCYKKGVAHRDLKCDNILLDESNNVKLSDFGLSKESLNLETKMVILSQTDCGTLSYMAPEVIRGLSYDPFKADCWSLGICLYEMLFNMKPFSGRNLREYVQNQIKGAWKFPENIDVSDHVKGLLANLITTNPNERMSIMDIKKGAWTRKECVDIKRKQY